MCVYIYIYVFKKYVRSRFPSFDSPHLVFPCFFLSTTPTPTTTTTTTQGIPTLRSFWLELTLSSSISILVKFREKKLIMSTSISG